LRQTGQSPSISAPRERLAATFSRCRVMSAGVV